MRRFRVAVVMTPQWDVSTQMNDMRKPIELKIAYRLIGQGPVVLVSSLYDGWAGDRDSGMQTSC